MFQIDLEMERMVVIIGLVRENKVVKIRSEKFATKSL